MVNLTRTFVKHYKDKDLYQQRKVEYGLGLLIILLVTTVLLTLIKAIISEIEPLELYITLANFVVFGVVFYIIYIGKLHLGITILTILGLIRMGTLFISYDIFHVFLFIPLILIMVAFMHTKKYQYYLVNMFVFTFSVYQVIMELILYYNHEISYEETIISFVSLFYTLAIMFILSMFIKVVDAEIEKSSQLFELSIKDLLTDTFNRRKIDRTFRTNVFSKRISVMLFDFDDFKKINDTYGHPIGDEVLTESIELVNTLIRKDDYVVRWGGEEFIVILHECDIEEAYQIAEGIRKQIKEIRYSFDNKLEVTVSIGIAKKDEKESIYDAISRADKALYKAKASGKDKTCKF